MIRKTEYESMIGTCHFLGLIDKPNLDELVETLNDVSFKLRLGTPEGKPQDLTDDDDASCQH